jgi:glycosyltransferase involved in cell wall biosynthesis/2-polyprenyl-3-methyl-5-hydroxy-6-metoxy-1,4-benzoquinol methylase
MSALTIAFLIDSVPFTKAVRDGETSLGGSESACLGLARALAARGHQVLVFATKLAPEAIGADAAGVVWQPVDRFARVNQFTEFDLVCALRMPQFFAHPINARLRMLWNQDLLLPGLAPTVMSVAWALDAIAYVSEYHRRQWEDQAKDLAPIGWVTKNGYDPAHVPAAVTKEPNRIVHVSRPERGLGPLLEMWPRIREANPNADLRLCRYDSMYDATGWGAVCRSFDDEVTAVNRKVGGITYLGQLNKAQLYREIADAAVMWYPGISTFAETSCIAAIEAQACGTPFVGSWKGALPETVPSGVLLPGDARTPEYQAQSIAEVLAAMDGCRTTSFAYRKLQQAGREHVKTYTYAVLAEEWEHQIEALFERRFTANKPRILRQLLHEDDHVAAKKLAEEIATGYDVTTRQITDTERAEYEQAIGASMFCDRVIAGLEQGADDYAAHAIQDPLDEVKYSDRFRFIQPYFKGCTRVLDVACGNGAGAIALALTHPTLHVVGLDYAPANIEHAIDAAARAGVGDRCSFRALTVYDFDTQQMHAEWAGFVATVADKFDGLFVGEFVEHVADCTLLVDALEAVLQDGAKVLYTCPTGPFGELVPHGQPIQRGHVHCFKHDDVKAVWGQKKDAAADFMEIGLTPRGATIGHWLVHYTVEAGRPAGVRDLATRIQRTRPFERLTIGLITKDAALDLARCLESVWPIADEILVGDTGSTDDTIAIAEKYGARVLTLASIREQPQGFAGARNEVLQAAAGEWFCWIDADEILVDGHQLRKYLEGAVFAGFVLHQTHLYLDQPPTYDIPVRVFRTGADIQFYGCIHEQPQQHDENTDIHPVLEPFDLSLAHTGYLTADARERKRVQRNLPLLKLDQCVFPNRLLGKVLLLRETAIQADAARAAAGGQLTPYAEQGFKHTIELFETHVADPAHKFHKIARPWYEAALRGLGLGYEMEIAIGGKAGGLAPGASATPDRRWVKDFAEFERLMQWKVQSLKGPMVPAPLKTDPFVDAPAQEPVSA